MTFGELKTYEEQRAARSPHPAGTGVLSTCSSTCPPGLVFARRSTKSIWT
ncbi:hypothetical protein ACNKHO_22400 [Shigella flexneri]